MARAAAEDIQNRVSISFFCLCLAVACAIIEKTGRNAPQNRRSRYGKIKLEIAGIPAVLYGKRSRRVYLYVHGKNGSAAEAARFARTASPGRLAGTGCRSAGARHPEKQPGKAGAVGGHPGAAGGLRPDAAGMEAYPGVWGQHRGVVCYAGVADAKTGRRRCWCPRSWIWKN